MGCGIVDTINMMWAADNDGDPIGGVYSDDLIGDMKSATGGWGLFFLNYPQGSGSEPAHLSYNWWTGFYTTTYDYGPRHKENYRDFRTGGLGSPMGDRNRYHLLSNGEIDYDMVYAASIPITDPVWVSANSTLAGWASTRGLPFPPHLLSVGPFDLPPGLEMSFPIALVGGEDIHTDPNNNTDNLPYSPGAFTNRLKFYDLYKNAMWARWIYDNPGYDTDADEYAGESVECDGRTIYYTGDGVPDWRGAMPPTAPEMWIEPVACGLRIRFNGTKSETEKDLFSDLVDFEGYRVYYGLDTRATSFTLVAAYDQEDYDKYIWMGPEHPQEFHILEPPFSADSLRILYGGASDSFDPLTFTADNPCQIPEHPDSVFYFAAHNFNTSEFGESTAIRKVYPNEPFPVSPNPADNPPEALTAEGNLKYYEYEFTLENLLPTIPYWVNVTALDFGAAHLGLESLESSVTLGAKCAYPLSASATPGQTGGKVYVYPNPYRVDANYRDLGFEGKRQEDRPDYRVRAVHFGNLPPKCSISIYSLDGDLVRRLDHDFDPSDPMATHDTWDLITRNTQMVVSGLYYWVVESPDGSTQMGKLVILL